MQRSVQSLAGIVKFFKSRLFLIGSLVTAHVAANSSSALNDSEIFFPDIPYDVVWEKKESHTYHISWQGSLHPDTWYLVFASNDPQNIDTFVTKTKLTSLIVDGRFCYYQIVASQGNAFSNPSEPLYLDFRQEEEDLVKYSKAIKNRSKYLQSKYVNDDIWNAVQPYLLPIDHPLKPKLDQIFNSGRVTATVDAFKKAGFELCKKLGLHVVVARHPSLKGIVVKIYVDHMSQEVDWKKWITRIKAANAIRSAIASHGYKSIFKVPQKWIYPLPDNSSPPDTPEYMRKHFILIAEDMNILAHQENKQRYRYHIKKNHMQALYTICEELGLADTPRIHNLPWTKDHYLAFVDTEAFQRWPVKYHPFLEYLNRENRLSWQEITAYPRQQ